MTLCLDEAQGVPGLGGQPPTWTALAPVNGFPAWDSALPSVSNPLGLDDPRWRGALHKGFPAMVGGTEAASFRALWNTEGGAKALYLSWHVKADASLDFQDDLLYVGFERSAGSPLVLEITPFTGIPATVDFPPATVRAWDLTSETPDPPVAVPGWVAANTRCWLDAGTNRWAVQMRVPIGGAGLALNDTFRMWFELDVMGPGNTLLPHKHPTAATTVFLDGNFFPSRLHFPALAQWDEFHLRTGPGDPVCPTTGFVSLATMDIGTTNAPISQINLVSNNVFEAKPENLTGAAIPANGIQAGFRLANWGSVGSGATWEPIPATGGTSNPAANGAAVANGTKGTISMQWQLTAAEALQFTSGVKSPHQCILVELTGAGIIFSPESVYRNMDFVSASKFSRVARISNVGLGASPDPGQPRDAYLLVEKINMPARVVPPPPPPPERGRGPSTVPGAGGGNQDPEAQRLLEAAAKATGSELDRLEAREPTYRVHALHWTGRLVERASGTKRELQAGTAFGFFVDHQGQLSGWRDEIQGAIQLTPTFYRLPVPEESEAKVTTVIEAVERGPQGCLLWILDKLLDALRKIIKWIRDRLGGG